MTRFIIFMAQVATILSLSLFNTEEHSRPAGTGNGDIAVTLILN